jgi:tetratricopeptide (TPR) repeat protein
MGNSKSKKSFGKSGEDGAGKVSVVEQNKQTLIDEAKQDFQEGNNFFRDRKFDQAKQKYSSALEKLTRCEQADKGQHHAMALTNLGAIEFAEGRYKEAKDLLQKALEERRRAIEATGESAEKHEKEGDGDNLTAISLAMKRDMAFRQLPDSERLLAGEIKDHATIDAMTSDLFNNLAACCEVIGDLKEAQQFYEESLALRKVHTLIKFQSSV